MDDKNKQKQRTQSDSKNYHHCIPSSLCSRNRESLRDVYVIKCWKWVCFCLHMCTYWNTFAFFLFSFIPTIQTPFVRTTIQFYGCVDLLFSNLLDDGFAGRLTSLNCISKRTKYYRIKDTYYKCNQIWVNIILVRLQLTSSYFEILNWCI